jgi:hypothetical protein
MKNTLIAKISCCGFLSIWLWPQQLIAQVPTNVVRTNPAIYENDLIKVVIQDCSRKLQDLVCKAVLTSKNSDRTIDINGNNIKLVDFEGNEYYPTNLRLANRIGENNSIKAELIENIPFKASFVFTKIPTTLTQIALLQIPLSGGLNTGINTMAKFRNFAVATMPVTGTKPAKNTAVAIVPTTTTTTNAETAVNDNAFICPDRTKILYRAASKSYLIYICGVKNPTHYVGLAKDGSQGITLRLRYYDRTQFSADNGERNYTIASERLVIRKDNKVIYQEKIQVLQSLPGVISAEEPIPKPTKSKKIPAPVNNDSRQQQSSTNQPGIRNKSADH